MQARVNVVKRATKTATDGVIDVLLRLHEANIAEHPDFKEFCLYCKGLDWREFDKLEIARKP